MCLHISGGCKCVADGDITQDTDIFHDSQSLYGQATVPIS